MHRRKITATCAQSVSWTSMPRVCFTITSLSSINVRVLLCFRKLLAALIQVFNSLLLLLFCFFVSGFLDVLFAIVWLFRNCVHLFLPGLATAVMHAVCTRNRFLAHTLLLLSWRFGYNTKHCPQVFRCDMKREVGCDTDGNFFLERACIKVGTLWHCRFLIAFGYDRRYSHVSRNRMLSTLHFAHWVFQASQSETSNEEDCKARRTHRGCCEKPRYRMVYWLNATVQYKVSHVVLLRWIIQI